MDDFLDIEIDYYMTTDFDGFENIIDILGVLILMLRKKYIARIDVLIDLKPGPTHLDGAKALQYVAGAATARRISARQAPAAVSQGAAAGDDCF